MKDEEGLKLEATSTRMIIHMVRNPEECTHLVPMSTFVAQYPVLHESIQDCEYDPITGLENLVLDNLLMDDVYRALVTEGNFVIKAIYDGEKQFSKADVEARVRKLIGNLN